MTKMLYSNMSDKSTLEQIAIYRDAVKDADTLTQLAELSDEIIGHHEDINDENARDMLLEYLDAWQIDEMKNRG
jgi:hypothetical protein